MSRKGHGKSEVNVDAHASRQEGGCVADSLDWGQNSPDSVESGGMSRRGFDAHIIRTILIANYWFSDFQ